ncbi:MAG: Transglycosylase-associated protein [Methanothrix harundinacea]|jgi:Transglycosylase associated protein.|uniref:Transglycosylase-associated protein n=1 Tax=Methanothrix harundinacea TaxID=301375 RepID=A0A124G2W6_9EURY|nr:MAG: Transglycosylase-associated protein [Methanothrix harundinacea]
MFGWLWFLIIGIAAGWLAGHITRGEGYGLLGNMVVGVIGAFVGGFVGGFLFGLVGLSAHGFIGSLIAATVGAVVFLFLLRYLKRFS